MSAMALVLQIQQRVAKGPTPAGNGEAGHLAPAPTGDSGQLQPLTVPKGTKVIGTVDGKSPRMQGFKDGRKQYDFKVGTLYIPPDQVTAIGEDIEGGTMLGADGKPTVRFYAERATMNTATNDLDIQGQVRVESADPKNYVVFTTRDMKWLARAEQLQCPNPVEVTQSGVVLRANSMSADVRLKKLHLERGIHIVADADKVKERVNAADKGGAKGGRR